MLPLVSVGAGTGRQKSCMASANHIVSTRYLCSDD
jgi:hypothetical protein